MSIKPKIAGPARAGVAVLAMAVLLASAVPRLEAQSLIKRYVVAVGANSGGKARVRLKYAVSDAQSIARIFEELGGVAKEDVLLLIDPDSRTFYTEMGRLQERMARNKPNFRRTEMFFYYSGHSDEEHIMLGEDKISYQHLRDTIGHLPADVRIAILDSCASGVFARLKGGKKKAPFLLDEAYNMTGQAFMTSSSATEASQESDLIKSSFFTHYLLSGMRGAADMSQDKRVTLSEAYQFAFQETLAETTRSAGGPQHPNYSIEMVGTGDVVMTDLSTSSALLVLEKPLAGRLFIHDQNDRLVVELTKPAGREVFLGLEPGEYRLVNIPEERVYESRVTMRPQDQVSLGPADFVKTDRAYTTPRGDRALRLHDLPLYRETGFEGRPIVNNVGIPTGYTLNKREVILGLGNVCLGVSDRFQLSTNVLFYLVQLYNGEMRYGILKSETVNLAAGLEFNYLNINADDGRLKFFSISPYAAISYKAGERVNIHVLGRLSKFSTAGEIEEVELKGYLSGTTLMAGLEYSVSRRMKLLAEAGYDATFSGFHLAGSVLFGWDTFRLKLGVDYLRPKNYQGFTLPIIGLWWRFRV
jgi:hypothetical protein